MPSYFGLKEYKKIYTPYQISRYYRRRGAAEFPQGRGTQSRHFAGDSRTVITCGMASQETPSGLGDKMVE